MKANNWKWIERAVLIGGMIGMFVAWQSDRAKWSTKLDTLIQNDEKRTEYWNRQNEINGRFLMYLQLDSNKPGTGE